MIFFFSYFSQENRLRHSMQIVSNRDNNNCLQSRQCQYLFSEKKEKKDNNNNKNISRSSAENLLSLLRLLKTWFHAMNHPPANIC